MKVSVIRIGNSRGIRIPKAILEQCQLKEEVELDVQEHQLIIRQIASPRKGWDDAFRMMHAKRDDTLLDEPTLPPTRWDRTEWQW